MTKTDQRNLKLLILLVVALGLLLFWGFRTNRSPNAAIAEGERQKAAAAATPSQADARIRLDLLQQKAAGRELGRKNLFQYGSAPSPAVTAPPPAPAPVRPPITSTPQPVVSQPPPPPPIPLKFVGFAFIEPNSKQLIATVLDDNRRPFNFVEGDIYQGRYRVARITETAVEIEDLELPRRQTLILVKQ